eukprot:7522213-Pyramimonas_sp.AAC.1
MLGDALQGGFPKHAWADNNIADQLADRAAAEHAVGAAQLGCYDWIRATAVKVRDRICQATATPSEADHLSTPRNDSNEQTSRLTTTPSRHSTSARSRWCTTTTSAKGPPWRAGTAFVADSLLPGRGPSTSPSNGYLDLAQAATFRHARREAL